MYLKSLEIQGFKSFANKIVLDFHNGITGIVGPNGSGKSNVADAVRWVLGEQSAKQLRGASMQDVIFAGTQNRKPLSYAYVAITLDNSDHELAIDYEEVTVARRVYRSGESEYLLNGSVCRLKEVTELFYDTGIGKEGYSIIGQGQIDRILSGKPEERRELFDEAAGIVKYKKRKTATQKKLESERDNLVRVNDILAELERQVGPLQKQSEKARNYLKKREELREHDVNLFLLERNRIEEQQKEVEQKYRIADGQMKETSAAYERTKQEYEKLEQGIADMEEQITAIRENISSSTVTKEKLESQIRVLEEQIHTAETTDEHFKSRLDSIEQEKQERAASRKEYEQKKDSFREQIAEIENRRSEAERLLSEMQAKVAECNEKMEEGQKEVIALLNHKVEIESAQQRLNAMMEQINIRKSRLNKQLLERKSKEGNLEGLLAESEAEYAQVEGKIREHKEKEEGLTKKEREWKYKDLENNRKLEEIRTRYHKQQSRLESLKNIAERYDGYGNSIRRVMEHKADTPGLLGVVSDLIQVEKRYEIAIETALGGNIQNIVTEDEATAKKMISFLKENRYGRATFLPLTSVSAKGNPKNEAALSEPGIIGIASTLVNCEKKYQAVAAYLLERVLVADTIDHALALAKKNHYSLHIVTLEGEYLSPGGSMTGGAFKNSSNLLARNREIEELERQIKSIEDELLQRKKRRDDIQTALVLTQDEMEEHKEELQKLYLRRNTAKLNLEQAKQQQEESESVYQGLHKESAELEAQMGELDRNREKIRTEILQMQKRETQIKQESGKLSALLERHKAGEEEASQKVAKIQMEIAWVSQNAGFAQENIERIDGEIARFEQEKLELVESAKTAKEDVEKKRQEIEQIRQTIEASAGQFEQLEEQLKESLAQKDRMSAEYRGFFRKREEISEQINGLDKEIFRLNSQKERLEQALEFQTNYMWEEYELTPHSALKFRNEQMQDLPQLKKTVADLKDAIRRLGDVNVNAIEEYKEVSERYEFLKGQHEDLVQAEKTLIGIIEELDHGMRKQFAEKFAEIQREFDSSFKQLFGGGKGTLELVEGEDILECGIRIIAQPPGKKLQNMMQLSGGEKALSAIALLFAIQALKPSPFCLLDEIEAALDDSNVTRFAKYLDNLTKNTQFIVITHRRGTMNAADRLYGITMQEKGVSTLVSVNLIENIS